MEMAELGTLLFQIAHSLIALEQTLISGAEDQFNKKSEEGRANWTNPILSSLLMNNLSTNEQTNQSEIFTVSKPYNWLRSEQIFGSKA